MKIIVLTPFLLLGDALKVGFERRGDITVSTVARDLAELRRAMREAPADLVLIDVTQRVDLYDVRSIATERPEVPLVAFGLNEQRQEVIRCGRMGYTGYVSRDASVETLCRALSEIIEGRLSCPAEISGSLLRALFHDEPIAEERSAEQPLTRRESDVLQLIGNGLSNKEIARELYLSIATVKHHVHNILDKLHLPRRAQAMRRVRDAPWLASTTERPAQRTSVEK